MRKFEKISYEQFKKDFGNIVNIEQVYSEFKMPVRATKYSAGYDIYTPIDVELNPGEITKIPTGLKVALNLDEFLGIYIRSSLGFKYNVRICNQVGITDADYYNNEGNEGHIWISLQNLGQKPWKVEKNSAIAQGVFQKYLLADDDVTSTRIRTNGLGSTSKGDDKNE